MKRRTFAIDCFPESVQNYRDAHAIVAVDVIRATTTAVTGVSLGRRCFPVATLDNAVELAGKIEDSLLVGEVGGHMPYGFDVNNSPVDIEARVDVHRPMILLSTSGTRVICAAEDSQNMYVACLRNLTAQIAVLVAQHPTVALVGAGARGEFREEDELCCAWIADGLLRAGYAPHNQKSLESVERWRNESVLSIRNGNSARYLHRTGQTKDLEFVLHHVDDLEDVYEYRSGEIRQLAIPSRERRAG